MDGRRQWSGMLYGKCLNDPIVEEARRFSPFLGSSRRTVAYKQSYMEHTVGPRDQTIVNSCMIE